MWKLKVKNLQEQLEKERATRNQQAAKIEQLKQFNSEFQTQLEQEVHKARERRAKAGSSVTLSQAQSDEQEWESELTEEQRARLKEGMDRKYKEFKTLERNAELVIKEKQDELAALQKTLKEKEQLFRISTYKLNELKRNIKSTKLKPLQMDDDVRKSTLSSKK